jgi:D-sedoheptulose 7-phosphate isomerase
MNIRQHLEEAQSLLQECISDDQFIATITQSASLMADCINHGGKIFSCGNGGSMCDAMHFAEEMTGCFREDRKGLPAIAISDPSHISCTANDYGFEAVFSRYIESLGTQKDVLFAISTSGNSTNILNAAIVARQLGMRVIALTGNTGGQLAKHCDIEIRIPHHGYADRIQEMHIKIIHILIHHIESNI